MRSRVRRVVVDARNARGSEYRRVLATIAKKGACPFCPKNFRYHKHSILARRNGWIITRISWPYKNTRYHFLLIGEKHRVTLAQMTARDMAALLYLARHVACQYHIRGGALAMRFGDTRLTGATVVHMHAHLIVPKLCPKKGRALVVEFPIG